MLEPVLVNYLNRYLGSYVEGLDADSLRVSVWAGDVVLKNLKLRPEALKELNLPITVKSGVLGSLRLKVGPCASVPCLKPWHRVASNAAMDRTIRQGELVTLLKAWQPAASTPTPPCRCHGRNWAGSRCKWRSTGSTC